MRPTWTFAPGAAIWRVHPAVAGRLVGEERDLQQRRVTFFALDFPSGKVAWKGLAVEEQWWTGIDRIEGELLFIHGFAAPDLPTHRGMTVVDVPQGKVLWSNSFWTLDAVVGDRLSVLGDQRVSQGMLVVNARTGAIVHGNDAAPSQSESPQWWNTVAFPDAVIMEQFAAHSAAAPVLKQWNADAVVGAVEVLDRSPLLVVAGAIRRRSLRGESIEHALLVVHQGKKKLVHDAILSRDAHGPVMEAFFVQEGMLVYVKEGKVLCGVDLTNVS